MFFLKGGNVKPMLPPLGVFILESFPDDLALAVDDLCNIWVKRSA